jgi:hypothetical protein
VEPGAKRAIAYTTLFEVRVLDDSGNIVRGLDEEDFLVLEDGQKIRIESFEEQGPVQVTAAVLVDTGPNMSEDAVRMARDFSLKIIHKLMPDDKILLATYDKEVHFLIGPTSNRADLVDSVWNISAAGRKGFWKRFSKLFVSTSKTGWAIDETLHELSGSQRNSKMLVVISAGFGGLGEVSGEHMQIAGARFFALGVDNKLGTTFNMGGDQMGRRQVVRATGGFSFSAELAAKRVGALCDAMKHYYLIGFEPADSEKDITERDMQFRLPDRQGLRISFVRHTQTASDYF